MVISIVSQLRSLAKAYPQTAPHIAQVNDLMRKVLGAMMTHAQPGEPQAPPT